MPLLIFISVVSFPFCARVTEVMNTTLLSYGLLAIIFFCGLGACVTLPKTYREGKRIQASREASLLRIEKAANLLLNPQYAVEEIAEECGYASSETFTEDFKARRGMTPEEFRARIAEAHAPDEKGGEM